MKIKLLSLFILCLALQGCSSNPALGRPINFEKGISKIPEGYTIFIELMGTSECSYECHCAPGPIRPLYDFTASGVLWTDFAGLTQALSSPIVGFFGFGSYRDKLYVMDTLPYTLQPGDTPIVTVYSVDAQGTAIMDVYGETFSIKPGQSWTDSGDMMQAQPFGCHYSYNKRLTNFGLLARSQIRSGDPSLHP